MGCGFNKVWLGLTEKVTFDRRKVRELVMPVSRGNAKALTWERGWYLLGSTKEVSRAAAVTQENE